MRAIITDVLCNATATPHAVFNRRPSHSESEGDPPFDGTDPGWVAAAASAVIEVELWDRDWGGPMNPDDFLGCVQVPLSAAAVGGEQWYDLGPRPGHRRGNIKGQVALRVSLMAGDLVGVQEMLQTLPSVIMCNSDTTSHVPPAANDGGPSGRERLAEAPATSSGAHRQPTADTTRSQAEAEDPEKLAQMLKVVQAERRQAARKAAKEAADAYQRGRSGK